MKRLSEVLDVVTYLIDKYGDLEIPESGTKDCETKVNGFEAATLTHIAANRRVFYKLS
jgi:hypothetical protein